MKNAPTLQRSNAPTLQRSNAPTLERVMRVPLPDVFSVGVFTRRLRISHTSPAGSIGFLSHMPTVQPSEKKCGAMLDQAVWRMAASRSCPAHTSKFLSGMQPQPRAPFRGNRQRVAGGPAALRDGARHAAAARLPRTHGADAAGDRSGDVRGVPAGIRGRLPHIRRDVKRVRYL